MAQIVTKVRQLRLDYQAKLGRDVTTQEIADAIGITRAAMSRIERGLTTQIDFETLMKFIKFYSERLERPLGVGDILEYDPNNRRATYASALEPAA